MMEVVSHFANTQEIIKSLPQSAPIQRIFTSYIRTLYELCHAAQAESRSSGPPPQSIRYRKPASHIFVSQTFRHENKTNTYCRYVPLIFF